MFVVCLGAIGEGRAGHWQQVGVWRHQRGLWGAQQAPAGTTHAAVACQRGPDHCSRWGNEEEEDRSRLLVVYFTAHFWPGTINCVGLTYLWTAEWWEAYPRPGHPRLLRWGKGAPTHVAWPPSCGRSRGSPSGSAAPSYWQQGSRRASRSAASGAAVPSGTPLPRTRLSWENKD